MTFPLRLGDPEDFARVAKALRTPLFSEASVHRALRGAGQSVLGSDAPGADQDAAEEPGALLKLFVELKSIAREEVEQAMDRATLQSFLALDLIRAAGEAYESPVFLYPVGGMLIASDHYDKSLGADSVFPAIQTGTLQLLKLMPRSPVDQALDLCSGTGICGLVLSRGARRAVASDVTERAGHFARFNRLLNECGNLEIAVGDLYQAVEGRSFDRIVAHPPYVPSVDESKIWRDGGTTGESITRRIVEGLPRHLKPGGEFFALCLGSEQQDVPYQQRVRGWLGEAESEFDVMVATQKLFSPEELAAQLASKEADPAQHAERLEKSFREAGAARFCHGALAIRRHEAPGTRCWTMRVKLAPSTRAESFEAVFVRSRECAQSGFAETMPLRPARGAKATITHTVEGTGFVASELMLETGFPFEQSIHLQPWIFPVLRLFDGRHTGAEVFERARAEGAVPDGCALEDFASLMAMLAMQGYFDYGEPT